MFALPAPWAGLLFTFHSTTQDGAVRVGRERVRAGLLFPGPDADGPAGPSGRIRSEL